MKDKSQATAMSLTAVEREIIASEAQRRGLGLSATVRQLLREWAYYRQVVKIESLPRPEGGQEVPVVTFRGNGNG